MNAIVVFESLWGNTAAIARAIAEGIGGGTRAMSTAEATAAVLAEADLVVAGAPLMAFSLPSDRMRNDAAAKAGRAPAPDLSHPSMRDWLSGLQKGKGRAAAFETRLRGSPGSSTKGIQRGLADAGYKAAAKGQRFIVTGTYGPLREGELERARAWGAELAKLAA